MSHWLTTLCCPTKVTSLSSSRVLKAANALNKPEAALRHLTTAARLHLGEDPSSPPSEAAARCESEEFVLTFLRSYDDASRARLARSADTGSSRTGALAAGSLKVGLVMLGKYANFPYDFLKAGRFSAFRPLNATSDIRAYPPLSPGAIMALERRAIEDTSLSPFVRGTMAGLGLMAQCCLRGTTGSDFCIGQVVETGAYEALLTECKHPQPHRMGAQPFVLIENTVFGTKLFSIWMRSQAGMPDGVYFIARSTDCASDPFAATRWVNTPLIGQPLLRAMRRILVTTLRFTTEEASRYGVSSLRKVFPSIMASIGGDEESIRALTRHAGHILGIAGVCPVILAEWARAMDDTRTILPWQYSRTGAAARVVDLIHRIYQVLRDVHEATGGQLPTVSPPGREAEAFLEFAKAFPPARGTGRWTQ